MKANVYMKVMEQSHQKQLYFFTAAEISHPQDHVLGFLCKSPGTMLTTEVQK